MIIEKFYSNGTFEPAYYVESEGEAAIINPQHNTDQYIQKVKENKACLKYIFESQFQSDFSTKHLALVSKTGATIILGHTAEPNYKVRIAANGSEFKIGNVSIKVVHSIDLLNEKTTYLLIDDNRDEQLIFS